MTEIISYHSSFTSGPKIESEFIVYYYIRHVILLSPDIIAIKSRNMFDY